MITAIRIKRFKVFDDTEWIPVAGNVVFIGPNNCGKTSVLQALALWNFGVRKWLEKRQGSKAKKRTGVAINRKDLFAIPVSNIKNIWNNLFPVNMDRNGSNKLTTNFNNIEISVKGVSNGREWICGLEFQFSNSEIIFVRPLSALGDNILLDYQSDILLNIDVAFLPPMSGLKSEEEKLLFSTVEYRMGEGRTAEVLGNLCYQVLYPESESIKNGRDPETDWALLCEKLHSLFLVRLDKPAIDSKGIIRLNYHDSHKNALEIVSAGRGMQQIMLLMAYLLLKPQCIILLDEPDAHLEILKQEQVYELLADIAERRCSQLVIASHSEVILNKAIDNDDKVIAIYPASHPRLMNDRGTQLKKSLGTIGFDEYYLAHLKQWILYIEGSTDIAILKRFAQILRHPVLPYLEECFCKTVNTNDPNKVRNHFSGLKDADSSLTGIALYDHIGNPLNVMPGLHEAMWAKNEIENYFFSKELFLSWAKGKASADLFGYYEAQAREDAITKALDDVLPGAANRDPNAEYWSVTKASEAMEQILKTYYKYLGYPGDSSKKNFVKFIDYIPVSQIDSEITEKLDFILSFIPAHV